MGVIFLCLLVMGGGIAAILLARYSRRKHEELRAAGIREFDAARITHARTLAESFKLQFFGPQPKFFETAGRILAIGVVSVMIIILGILGVIIFRAWQ